MKKVLQFFPMAELKKKTAFKIAYFIFLLLIRTTATLTKYYRFMQYAYIWDILLCHSIKL